MFPYFETLLEHLRQGDTVVEKAFGQHVHWGYWENPRAIPNGPEEFHQAAEAMLRRMVQAAEIENGTKVLDVGCGFGGTINFLDKEYRNCMFVGVNIDGRQLEIAGKSVTGKSSNWVHFTQANACALPFRSNCFEAILCVESIFHFSGRQRFFEECGRVLKPGGVLVLSDFVPLRYFGGLMDRGERATRLVGRMYGRIHPDISISQYRVLARANGMESAAIDDITSNTLPTYRFLRRNFYRTRHRATYDRATFVLELLSKMKLVRYLILTFRKPSHV